MFIEETINFVDMRKIEGLLFLTAFTCMILFTGCGGTNDSPDNMENSNEPMIVETDEIGLKPDVTISNTIPTEGMEDGPFEQFYPNGVLQVEGMVVNGKRSGQWVSYHPAGNKQSENSYTNGVLEGKTVVYYPSGQIMYIGYFSSGKNDGQWLYFDEEGTLTKEVLYKNGALVSQVEKNEKPTE